jgi:hypothetical protein
MVMPTVLYVVMTMLLMLLMKITMNMETDCVTAEVVVMLVH